MVDTIYTGVDCCEDAERKGWDIHATPSRIWATPGQRFRLDASKFSRECDQWCVYWRIIKGGGVLEEEFGTVVTYRAADDNKNCAGSALIGLFCGGKLRDTIRAAINQYKGDEPAYYKAGSWHDNYYPQQVLAGSTVTDPETLVTEVIYTEKEAIIRYVPDKDYYGDTKPKVSTCYITEHSCDGTMTRREHVSIRNMATGDATGKKILLPGKWHGINPSSLVLTVLSKGNYTFEQAKQMSLDGYMDGSVRIYIPTQYTIPPRLPTYPGVEDIEIYNEKRRIFDMWMEYARRVREITLKERGVADIRNPPMIEGGCCSPDLI